jgi:hypothetical protein
MTRMLVLVIAGLMSPQDFVCRVGKTNVHASFVAVYVQDSLSRTVPMLASAKHTLRPPIGQLTSARRLAASCTPALVARTTTIQHFTFSSAVLGPGPVLSLKRPAVLTSSRRTMHRAGRLLNSVARCSSVSPTSFRDTQYMLRLKTAPNAKVSDVLPVPGGP